MAKITMRLAELRKRRGMTQQELADLLKVSFQSVSKWENNISTPDIALLPELSAIFGVSVDQLLGLVPFEEERYLPEKTGTEDFWNRKLEYLKRTRKTYFYESFVEYLIQKVLNITAPVDILDCGCGYGFLGLLLLPLLPPGSTYTGVDFAHELIAYGREEFEKEGLIATFAEHDFLTWQASRKYDLVIAQAVLRHVDNAEVFLEKMISHARRDGLIVSIETNREFECDGLYIEGMDYAGLCEHDGLQKKWKTEYEKQGRDYAVAMRVPFMMRRLGLYDIGVRMDDRVEFVVPEQEDYAETKQDFIDYNDWNYPLEAKEKERRIEYLLTRGMNRKEAEDYCNRGCRIARALGRDDGAYLFFKGRMISYGRKRG